MFERVKQFLSPIKTPLINKSGDLSGSRFSSPWFGGSKRGIDFKSTNQLEAKGILDSIGVQKAIVTLNLQQERLVLATPNFQRYRNIYNLIPEAASVINTLVSRLPNLELLDSQGYLDPDLLDELDSQYKLSSLVKNIALQYLVFENLVVSCTNQKTQNDLVESLEGFFVPSLNELSLFSFQALSVNSLYWFNSNFGMQKLNSGDFFFYKGTSVDNQFFGDSKLEPLYNSIYNLYKDGQNFTSFLNNNSFPGTLFIVPNELGEEQKEILRQSIDEWANDKSRFKAALLSGAEGLTTLETQPKINVVDVPSKEYIWKTIATSYSVPSELFLRTGGLGQGEQVTMLENLKNNALVPLATVVNQALKHFVLPKLMECSDFSSRIQAGSKLRIAEVNVETLTEKSARLKDEVMLLGRPLIDYYEKMEGITKEEAYKHYQTYYQPSGVMIQDIGETVTTETNADGQILEGTTEDNHDDDAVGDSAEPIIDDTSTPAASTPSPSYSLSHGKAAAEAAPKTAKASPTPEPKKSTNYSVSALTTVAKAETQDYFQKYLSGKQKKRIKEFSFAIKADSNSDQESSPVPKLFEKKEFTLLSSDVARILLKSYLLNYKALLKKYPDIETMSEEELIKVLKSYKYNNTGFKFITLANTLFLIGLAGVSNAEGQMETQGQPKLALNTTKEIKQSLKDMILGRLNHYGGNEVKLDKKTQKLLNSSLKQYDYKGIDLLKTSKDVLFRIAKESGAADKKTAFSEAATTRGKLIATNEALSSYGFGNSLAFLENSPVSKEKLPTASKNPREPHAAINGEIVPFKDKFSNGSFTFPDPNAINCECGIKAIY